MATIDDLLDRIDDADLRHDLSRAIAKVGAVRRVPKVQKEYLLTYAAKQPEPEILLETPALPFQHIRAFGDLPDGTWHNMLIGGDNLPALRRLKDMKADGLLRNADGTDGVRLVYIDPPFASEDDYETKSGTIAYADKIVGATFIESLRKRIVLLRDVMADDATIFVHLDTRKSHYIKVILDEVFGEQGFRNEVIWKRTNARTSADRWPRVHDVLLVYAQGQGASFTPELIPAEESRMPHTLITGPDGLKYQTYELTAPGVTRAGDSGAEWRGFSPTKMGRHWANATSVREEWDRLGQIHWPARGGFPRRLSTTPFRHEDRMIPVGDVWTDIDRLNQADRSRVYPTQKPEGLLRRILESSSRNGDIVLDCFAGSGTTLAVAEKLGRRWIGVDLGLNSIYTIQKRMLNIAGSDSLTETKVGKSTPKPCCGEKDCAHCQEFCCRSFETAKAVPYGREPAPFAVYSSGHYDFHQLKALPFEDYRAFVLRLFEAVEQPETINGVRIDGRDHRGDPVIVYDFHVDEEAEVTVEFLEELASYLTGRVDERVLFIAPTARMAFFEDRISSRGITFEVRRVPYSAVAALQRRARQPVSEAEINKIIETESFDFAVPPIVGCEIDVAGRALTITDFHSRTIARDLTEWERGFPALAMVLIDYHHDGTVFDLDDVVFAEDIKDSGYRVSLAKAKPGETIAVSVCDIFGNEHVKVLRDLAWGES